MFSRQIPMVVHLDLVGPGAQFRVVRDGNDAHRAEVLVRFESGDAEFAGGRSNPFELEQTVSAGIISGKGRESNRLNA